MEAANRGAAEAGGKTIGLNIGLPFEQFPNPYITPELSFEFHYFFMRKFWFAYLAKALVVFPGGFGTMDEMFEILTLAQTQKLRKKMTIVLYGSEYWKEVVNFDALVKYGTISGADLELFQYADDPASAFELLKEGLCAYAICSRTRRSSRRSRNRAIRSSRRECSGAPCNPHCASSATAAEGIDPARPPLFWHNRGSACRRRFGLTDA